ncbi:MAG: hypothetical protein M3P06_23315 [Acidobacteriota bacterium]|nr:hypothetical protein [Acidobacteriota bacterium]
MASKPESQRKKRQRVHPLTADVIENRIVERVEKVAAAHSVEAVESEFAGYFNELGFRINVAAEASTETTRILGNALLDATTQIASELQPPFRWLIGIYRNDELVRVLSPGDLPTRVCGNCWDEQRTVGSVCAVCGESLKIDGEVEVAESREDAD